MLRLEFLFAKRKGLVTSERAVVARPLVTIVSFFSAGRLRWPAERFVAERVRERAEHIPPVSRRVKGRLNRTLDSD